VEALDRAAVARGPARGSRRRGNAPGVNSLAHANNFHRLRCRHCLVVMGCDGSLGVRRLLHGLLQEELELRGRLQDQRGKYKSVRTTMLIHTTYVNHGARAGALGRAGVPACPRSIERAHPPSQLCRLEPSSLKLAHVKWLTYRAPLKTPSERSHLLDACRASECPIHLVRPA
jgi:hypothetical protein